MASTKEIYFTNSDSKKIHALGAGHSFNGIELQEPTLVELLRCLAEAERGAFQELLRIINEQRRVRMEDELPDHYILPYTDPAIDYLSVPGYAANKKESALTELAERLNIPDYDGKRVNDSMYAIGRLGEEERDLPERERVLRAKNNLVLVLNKPEEGIEDPIERVLYTLHEHEGDILFSVGAKAGDEEIKQGSLVLGTINPVSREVATTVNNSLRRRKPGLTTRDMIGPDGVGTSSIVTPLDIGFVHFRDVLVEENGIYREKPIDMKIRRPGEVSFGTLGSYAHGLNPISEADLVLGL